MDAIGALGLMNFLSSTPNFRTCVLLGNGSTNLPILSKLIICSLSIRPYINTGTGVASNDEMVALTPGGEKHLLNNITLQFSGNGITVISSGLMPFSCIYIPA